MLSECNEEAVEVQEHLLSKYNSRQLLNERERQSALTKQKHGNSKATIAVLS